jgi:hypothetical protein
MEKKWLSGLALMTVLALYVAASPQADVSTTRSGSLPCPALLSEMECTAYQAAITSMPPGTERDQLIASMHSALAERESACSCLQPAQQEVAYPRVEQVALKL